MSSRTNPVSNEKLLQRGLMLEYATLSWNVLGTVVLAVAAVAARSVAIAGFGVDSLIEIVASAVVVWQLKGEEGSGRQRRRSASSPSLLFCSPSTSRFRSR
jgi:hypothetical protein